MVHEQGSTVLPFIIYERKFPFAFSNMGLLNGNKLGCGSGAEIEIFFTVLATVSLQQKQFS